MLILVRLLFTAITLYLFFNIVLDNFDDRYNAITNKIYLFLFVFIINFLFNFSTILININSISINSLVESAINNALLSVISFDIYNDLIYNGYFKNYTFHQKTLVLLLLIISFMACIKILQLVISSNY